MLQEDMLEKHMTWLRYNISVGGVRVDEELTVLDCSQASLFRPDDRSSMEKKTLDCWDRG